MNSTEYIFVSDNRQLTDQVLTNILKILTQQNYSVMRAFIALKDCSLKP